MLLLDLLFSCQSFAFASAEDYAQIMQQVDCFRAFPQAVSKNSTLEW